MRKTFHILVIALTFFILNSCRLYGQLSSRDSIIIKKYDAIKLTDSVCSSVPVNIRSISVDYLLKHGLNPNEYYTLGLFQSDIGEVLNEKGEYERMGFLHILRFNALKDLSCGPLHVGASGGKDDDLLLLFDIEYKKVLKMTINE